MEGINSSSKLFVLLKDTIAYVDNYEMKKHNSVFKIHLNVSIIIHEPN